MSKEARRRQQMARASTMNGFAALAIEGFKRLVVHLLQADPTQQNRTHINGLPRR
jgi:hypothetical protein